MYTIEYRVQCIGYLSTPVNYDNMGNSWVHKFTKLGPQVHKAVQ